MDELRESSLLFSLESLLETERERVQREAREAQRQRDEEMARVAEAAERRRVAAQQEREARERREALEQERERHEQERLEAMKRAVVERARIEAEGNARLREAEQQRLHERSLAELGARQQTLRYRTFTWLSTGALVLSWAGVAFAHFGLLEPAHQRREQQLQGIISTAAERAKIKERELSLERSKNQTLQERVQQLSDAQPALAETPGAGAKPGVTHGPGPKPPVVQPPVRECVDDGDPLNAQLCRARGSRR
jgi:fused signal recognition particle receptor